MFLIFGFLIFGCNVFVIFWFGARLCEIAFNSMSTTHGFQCLFDGGARLCEIAFNDFNDLLGFI